MFGPAREFLLGARFLLHGLGLWTRSPRLMLLGAAPAFVVGILYLAALTMLALNLSAVAAWLTPFAAEWGDAARVTVQVVAGAALLGLVVLLALLAFTTITLIVGAPFYEKIWRSVEIRAGGLPEREAAPFLHGLGRSIGEGLRLFLATALIGMALFAGGFIPFVGQSVIPVLAVGVGGWFLTVELTGLAFEARGLSLKDRRRTLGSHRPRTLGFGMATFLMFLIPLGAVIVMPAAVAGATMLSRSMLVPGALTPAAHPSGVSAPSSPPSDASAPMQRATGTTPGRTCE